MNEDKKMFAVIKTGGKQYKVVEEDVVQVEKLDAKTGSKIAFDNVLMVGDFDMFGRSQSLCGEVNKSLQL